MQKKDSQRMFAMKYMNKRICVENDAIRNVVREMELLRKLDHPFLVNLWFTFQVSFKHITCFLLISGSLSMQVSH